MGQIKVVLIFNEDDERQREAGEYLKTKKRCKTALVTELVQAWMKNGEAGTGTYTGAVSIDAIKKQLLQDKEFLLEIEKSMGGTSCREVEETEPEDSDNLDMGPWNYRKRKLHMREADFSERIKTILCERVGGRCSNPNCRRETLGPHREGDKRLSIGEAAHILGASPKGARYDARMTKEERESINNGIWLCSACHTLIDKNPDEYPVEELLKWKMIAEYEQERRLKGEDIVSFQSQQMERKKEALKQVKYATDCFHDLLEYSYKYWKMNFAQSFSNPIDLQNEIDDHHFMYEEELLHINKYLEKRDDLYEALNQHSLDLGKQVVELLNEYINLTTFQYYDDGIGMANNYWSSFFNMISKNIDNLRKIKKETDDILYSMYSA